VCYLRIESFCVNIKGELVCGHCDRHNNRVEEGESRLQYAVELLSFRSVNRAYLSQAFLGMGDVMMLWIVDAGTSSSSAAVRADLLSSYCMHGPGNMKCYDGPLYGVQQQVANVRALFLEHAGRCSIQVFATGFHV